MDRRTERRDEGVVIGGAVTRRRFMQYGAGAGAGLVIWRFAGGRAWAAGSSERRARPAVDSEVRQASGDPACDAAAARKPPGKPRQGSSTTTRSRSASSGSRSCRRAWVWSRPGSGAMARWTTRRRSTTRRSRSRHAWRRPVRVKWINGLVKPNGDFRPHLLPVDQTLHWANPPGGPQGRDGHGSDHAPYRGPVPIVTHLHGGHSSEEFDGYPEAWFLPKARNIPGGIRETGLALSELPGTGPARARPGLDARQRGLPVRQRPARDDHVVPRPHARHDPRQRLRRAGGLLSVARGP